MVEDYLDMMDDAIDNAQSVPFSNKKSIVDTDLLREYIDKIRMNMPTEMKQAQKLVADRKSIIEEANRQAESIITSAEAKAKELVVESEITKNAQIRANEIEKQANIKAREIKGVTDDYIIEMLTRAEETLAACHEAVRRTKGTLKPSENGQEQT